jgi:hypothetical protein
MSGKWISIGRSPMLTLRESATVTESTGLEVDAHMSRVR